MLYLKIYFGINFAIKIDYKLLFRCVKFDLFIQTIKKGIIRNE